MSSIKKKAKGRNGEVSTNNRKEANTEGIVEERENTKDAWKNPQVITFLLICLKLHISVFVCVCMCVVMKLGMKSLLKLT